MLQDRSDRSSRVTATQKVRSGKDNKDVEMKDTPRDGLGCR